MVNPAIHRLPNAKPNRQYVTARRPTYVTDGIPTLYRAGELPVMHLGTLCPS